MSVRLVPLGRDASGRVAHVRAAPEGHPACGSVEDILSTDPDRIGLHVIEEDGQAVGLLAVERHRRGVTPPVPPGELALRAVVIDAARQGRGLGTEALRKLGPYLAAHHPGAQSVVLSIDRDAEAARRACLKAGFSERPDDGPNRRTLRLSLPPLRLRGFYNWRGRMARALVGIRRRVPPGLRLLLGILLMAGGVLGFLPILGFWMIPLGLAVAALDVRPMWRWLRGRRRNDDGR